MTEQTIEKGRIILDRMHEASDPNSYGGYISIYRATSIVYFGLFGKQVSYATLFGKGSLGKAHAYSQCMATSEEARAVRKTLNNMLDKGIIKISKNHRMVKVVVSTEEWMKRVRS